ncbi:MAG: thiol reductant ABC exporter subunit CydC [Actinomycetes bacterium]
MSPVRALWKAMSAQRTELAAAALVGFLASASAIALLGTSAWLISRAAEMPPVLTLSVAAVMVRAFALGRAVFRYLERLLGHDAAFRGLSQLRVSVYESLEAITPNGLARFTRGDLIARLGADVDTAVDLPLRIVLPWAQAVLVSLGTIAFLVWLLPAAGVVIGIVVLLALTVVPWLVGRTAAHAEERLAPGKADLANATLTSMTSASDLLVLGADDRALASLRGRDERVTALGRRESAALGLSGGTGTVFQGAAVVAALVIAIPAVADGRLPAVMLAVAALLPLALFDVLQTLPGSALAFHRLRGSAARLADIHEASHDEPVAAAGRPGEFRGLEVTDLRARWAGASTDAIAGVSLSIAPGERIAIVGPSGSGKSTLATVLMGFLPYDGSAVACGAQFRDLDGDLLRERIGMMEQSSHVFDTTIAANVRLAHREATEAQVWAALDEAQLADWVRTLPAGLETEVGSFGTRLSGGQQQRVALARLLLAQRELVILDEPTEHLDAQTAEQLDLTLLSATQGRTSILITHRLTGLEAADRIYVLDQGRVIEHGTHDELMSSGGWYAATRRRQDDQRSMAELIDGLPVGVGVPVPPLARG